MPSRVPGTIDTSRNPISVNDGTSVLDRSTPPGTLCATEHPNWLDRLDNVKRALTSAETKVVPAIQHHTGEEFQTLIQGIVPGLLLALGGLLATTLTGGAIGALFGGVGAGPGALAGFEVGLLLLNYLGIGFLAYYVLERMDEVTTAFGRGIDIAWNSCGDRASIDAAARELAEGVGIFFRLVLQALVIYLLKAASEANVSGALAKLGESRLFKAAPKLQEWLARNYRRLGEEFGMPEAVLESAEFVPPNTRTYVYDMLNNPGPLAESNGIPQLIRRQSDEGKLLAGSRAANFAGGKYNETILSQPTIMYRAQPAPATIVTRSEAGVVTTRTLETQTGPWFSPQPPASGAIARIDYALRHRWVDAEGNVRISVNGDRVSTGSSAAEVVLAVRIPAGTKVYYGPIANQGGINVGGMDKIQIYIPDLNKINGLKILTETQLESPTTQGVIDAIKNSH